MVNFAGGRAWPSELTGGSLLVSRSPTLRDLRFLCGDALLYYSGLTFRVIHLPTRMRALVPFLWKRLDQFAVEFRASGPEIPVA